MKPILFPVAVITLSLGAAGAYLFDGDWKRAVYWVAGAVMIAVVTF